MLYTLYSIAAAFNLHVCSLSWELDILQYVQEMLFLFLYTSAFEVSTPVNRQRRYSKFNMSGIFPGLFFTFIIFYRVNSLRILCRLWYIFNFLLNCTYKFYILPTLHFELKIAIIFNNELAVWYLWEWKLAP